VKEKISQIHLTIFEAIKEISEAVLMTSSIHYEKDVQINMGKN
jgi:hypothetical protein